VRLALACQAGHAPGQVLHAVQQLHSRVDDRLRLELGGRYDRHRAESAGADKLIVTFVLRASTPADAMRAAGAAAAILADLLSDHSAAVDLGGVALLIRSV
jgi:hypothetical protein